MTKFAKYIIIQCGHNDYAFVFPAVLVHREIAAAIQASRDSDGAGMRGGKIVAAGFVDGGGKCYGESESLLVKSRGPVDEDVIEFGCHNLAATSVATND
jgi:hypothetical protein